MEINGNLWNLWRNRREILRKQNPDGGRQLFPRGPRSTNAGRQLAPMETQPRRWSVAISTEPPGGIPPPVQIEFSLIRMSVFGTTVFREMQLTRRSAAASRRGFA